MKAALDQLKYTTSDVDVVELKVNWGRYSKVEKKMQEAIDNGDEAAVKEMVEEWDFADKDKCVVLGRKFLAGELKRESKVESKPITPPAPAAAAAKPAENDDEYSDDHEGGGDHESSPTSGQVSVKSLDQDVKSSNDAESETNDFEAESEDD